MWEVTGYSRGSDFKYVSRHSKCIEKSTDERGIAAEAPLRKSRKSRKLRHHMRLSKRHKLN